VEAWHAATVPGVVQTDLLQAGLIDDPFHADNEKHLQWIGKTDWEYRSSFTMSAAQLSRRHIELVFDGLDTFADVTLNGHMLLHADNMFRAWRVDVKPLLVPGENHLSIVFHSPITTLTPIVAALPYVLPGTGFEPFKPTQGIYPVSHYMRKSPYQFGWDWAPALVTQGIWRPMRLESWDDLRVDDLEVKQNAVSASRAQLAAEVTVQADTAMKANAVVLVTSPAGATRTVHLDGLALDAGENHLSIPFRIDSPSLWYPNGYGRPDRYTFALTLSSRGIEFAHAAVKTGLRTVELRREPDEWGKSFTFVINGVPIFAQGANVVPFDSFPSRVTLAQQRRILAAAHDSHFNMLRLWGGGYYESDEFYDLCDELGLMVWQEFIFGGAMVPGDTAFQNNVRAEAAQQVMRLRNHPSIVLWCGNNEVETGWTSWGDRKKFAESITPQQRERVWQDYVVMFRDILKGIVVQQGNGVPYWSSSPSADFDEPAGNDHNGDMHYWNVWSGQGAPIEEYLKQTPRFMSEYGFQSMPDLRTVREFAGSDEDLKTAALEDHERYVQGFDRMNKYLGEYYCPPKDFASFVYLSQVMQAEAIKLAAEHLRSSMPRTMGSLFWQLNDCWPAVSWSSIDYFGRWKALQYYAQRFYAPVLIAPVFDEGMIDVHVASNRRESFPALLRLRLMDMHGRVLAERLQELTVAALNSTTAMHIKASDLAGFDAANTFAVLDLMEKGETVARNILYFAHPREMVLPSPHLQATIAHDGAGYAVHITTDTLARDVALSFGNLEAQPHDNFFDLLPGESVTVHVDSTAGLAAMKAALHTVSLADATSEQACKK
jgi:beta-mannosidase